MKKNSALIDTGYVSNYILDYFKKRGINFIIRSFKEEEFRGDCCVGGH